jgi:hypothetical protein
MEIFDLFFGKDPCRRYLCTRRIPALSLRPAVGFQTCVTLLTVPNGLTMPRPRPRGPHSLEHDSAGDDFVPALVLCYIIKQWVLVSFTGAASLAHCFLLLSIASREAGESNRGAYPGRDSCEGGEELLDGDGVELSRVRGSGRS